MYIRCVGEVVLADEPLASEEYEKCSIEIRVKFREEEAMQVGWTVGWSFGWSVGGSTSWEWIMAAVSLKCIAYLKIN